MGLGAAASADLLEFGRADAMLGQPLCHPRIEAGLWLAVVPGLAGGQGGRLASGDPGMAPFVLLGQDLGAALGEGPEQVPVMQPLDLRCPGALVHLAPAHVQSPGQFRP